MFIEKLSFQQIQSLIDLSQKSVIFCCANDYSEKQLNYWVNKLIPDFFDRLQQNPSDFLKVVEMVDSQIVGGCFFDIESKKIKGLYVSSLYLNKKIGKNLMLELEKILLQRGFEHVYVDASFNAIKFYESLEYCQLKTTTPDIPEVPSVKMIKAL